MWSPARPELKTPYTQYSDVITVLPRHQLPRHQLPTATSPSPLHHHQLPRHHLPPATSSAATSPSPASPAYGGVHLIRQLPRTRRRGVQRVVIVLRTQRQRASSVHEGSARRVRALGDAGSDGSDGGAVCLLKVGSKSEIRRRWKAMEGHEGHGRPWKAVEGRGRSWKLLTCSSGGTIP